LYAILVARRKLRHYFESHPMTIVSSFPLREVIHNHEVMGRIAKWAVELMGEGITYAPRKAIKSQVLADFVAEWTETQTPSAPVEQEYYMIYFDGSLMKSGARAGLVFISSLDVHMRYMI
jgi:ATP sulfurylase